MSTLINKHSKFLLQRLTFKSSEANKFAKASTVIPDEN
jgi:hypothetical protein